MPAKTLSRFELADIELAEAHSKPNSCTLCCWLATLEAGDAAGLQRLFALPVKVKGHSYLAWLIEREGGPRFNRKVVANHRQYHTGQ